MATRNILKTLQTEHDTVRALFEELNGTTDRAEKTRAQLLADIEANLLPHAKWEESVFYPAFRERADREGVKAHSEAVLEHKSVENVVIPSVKEAEFTTPEFAGRAKVFGEQIEHHAKEEEKTMFKMAREMFSAEERAQLDEEYEAWKRSPAADSAVAAAKAKTGMKGAVNAIVH